MRTVLRRLYDAPWEFEFDAAVRVLAAAAPARRMVGGTAPPADEIVRFRGHPSFAPPAADFYQLAPPTADRPVPRLDVTISFGLYGVQGVLPTHYTQAIIPTALDEADLDRQALRDWLDLFNHRFVSLFYRAWEKYRFYRPFERGEHRRAAADPFTAAIRSLMGFGTRGLTGRLVVRGGERPDDGYRWGTAADRDQPADDPTVLARIDDTALLRYAGLFVQRPRNAVNLRLLLEDYFQLPVRVDQFRGQWLDLPDPDKPRLGVQGALGIDTVVGDRVWDVQSRFRLAVGPLDYPTFTDLLPDRSPVAVRKTLFLLSQLTRTFVGPELDFEVQLLLAADQVPAAELADDGGLGPRLGWNVWLTSVTPAEPAGDAVFEGEWVTGV